MTKPKPNGGFAKQLEQNIAEILKDPEVSIDQRLKAIEAGAKLLLIRHRIQGASEGEDGKFFSKTS